MNETIFSQGEAALLSVFYFYMIFNAYQRLLPLRREGLFSV